MYVRVCVYVHIYIQRRRTDPKRRNVCMYVCVYVCMICAHVYREDELISNGGMYASVSS
jgi:hypothetical protein